jgi:hypothetical protein
VTLDTMAAMARLALRFDTRGIVDLGGGRRGRHLGVKQG